MSGADVTDFKASDSAAGNLEDVKALIKDARKIGLKVLLEIDPNLSSDQHPFFKDSVAKLDSRKVNCICYPARFPAGSCGPLFVGLSVRPSVRIASFTSRILID